jgi:2-polyprenyl-3-methyl-5-hydroxy-6-metoxy-1,4-benzoquinol methylase
MSHSRLVEEIIRDTDADWNLIGSTEPFVGVFPDGRFLRTNLDNATLEEFWNSGVAYIKQVIDVIEHVFRQPFEPDCALDFGCGVGRLTRPMSRVAKRVVGVDVSTGMLEEAKRHPHDNIEFLNRLPDYGFDWINSAIVLQHIPPERGSMIFEELLDHLLPGGILSVQVTLFRDQRAVNQTVEGARFVYWDGKNMRVLQGSQTSKGTMKMYDYDMNRILASTIAKGLKNYYLEHTDHGGSHGVIIYGHRPK